MRLDAPEHQRGPIQLRLDDGFGNTSSTPYDRDADVTCDPADQDCPAHDLACLDLGSSPPAVACTQTPRYRRAGDPCNDLGQPLCEPGTVCNEAAIGEDCSDPTSADFFPGCCVPACRLDGDSSCPEAGQRCVPFTAEGATADSGLCTYDA